MLFGVFFTSTAFAKLEILCIIAKLVVLKTISVRNLPDREIGLAFRCIKSDLDVLKKKVEFFTN